MKANTVETLMSHHKILYESDSVDNSNLLT